MGCHLLTVVPAEVQSTWWLQMNLLVKGSFYHIKITRLYEFLAQSLFYWMLILILK